MPAKATAVRHATRERVDFDSYADALWFALRRAETAGELWQIEW